MQDIPQCPGCSTQLKKRPQRKTKCKTCGEFIFVVEGTLMTEPQIEAWRTDLVAASASTNLFPCIRCGRPSDTAHGRPPGSEERVSLCYSCEDLAVAINTATGNQNSLELLRRDSEFVKAVQFVAVMDGLTHEACRLRNGMILMIDDPRLDVERPPFHPRCRSTWSPISTYSWELLEKEDPRSMKRTFGYLEKGGPRNLAEALDWSAVPPPPPYQPEPW